MPAACSPRTRSSPGHYARNHFARREEAYRLWVVPQEAIHEVADLDLLRPPGDHRYRLAGSYRLSDKRKRVKARVERGTGS